MFLHSDLPPALRSRIAIATCVGLLIAAPLLAQTIKGTATYRERIALPPGALFEAAIEDVSRADAPASTLATTRIMSPGNPPIKSSNSGLSSARTSRKRVISFSR
jgi:uncharacterized lipoprotein YbaY